MNQIWPDMTISTHEFRLNSNKADIAVNVPNEDKHDYVITELKFNSNKADIEENVPNVAKHDILKTQ